MGTDEGSMTELAYEQLPPAKRRQLVLRASLRALATTTVLVARSLSTNGLTPGR
jgi:hypothetical protein